MPITQGVANQFKADLWTGVHVWGTDVLKIALFTNAPTLGPATATYAATGEVTGPGYTAGGLIVTPVAPSGTTVSFVTLSPNPSWPGATFTARGAMLYNTSKSNKVIAIWDFGGDFSVSAGTFTLQMPVADAVTALLRIG